MGFFSKKISINELSKTLTDSFNVSYNSLTSGFKENFGNEQISEEQEKEFMIVSMLAITWAILSVFDRNNSNTIIDKFHENVFNKYLKNNEEKKNFAELFLNRWDEYKEILDPKNNDLAIQFGQIFCNHFYNKKEDGSHMAIMIFIGTSFLNHSINLKKFLDETKALIKL